MSSPALQTTIRLSNFYVTRLEFKMDSGAGSRPVGEGDPLKIELEQKIGLPQTPQNSFIVIFDLKLTDEESGSISLSLQAVAEFQTSVPVDADFGATSYVQVSGPAIAFPFLRSYVHTVTMHSGAPGIILPALNFTVPKAQGPPKPTTESKT